MKSLKFFVPILFFSLFLVSSVPIMGMADIVGDTIDAVTDSAETALQKAITGGERSLTDAESKLLDGLVSKLSTLGEALGENVEAFQASAKSVYQELSDRIANLGLTGEVADEVISNTVDDITKKALDPASLKSVLENTIGEKLFPNAIKEGVIDTDSLTGRQLGKLTKAVGAMQEEITRAAEATEEGVFSKVSSAFKAVGETLSDLKKGFEDWVEKNPIKGGIITGIGSLGFKIGETLAMAVLFMVPNIIQSQVEAEAANQAALDNLAQPVLFGDWVVQILPQCLNINTPSESVPLYAMIPVASVGASVPNTVPGNDSGFAGAAAVSLTQQYNISGMYTPYSILNPVSSEHGTTTLTVVNGYLLGSGVGTTDYLKTAQLVCSYPVQSYDTLCSAAITDPNFSGQLVNLNTGYVVNATGQRAQPLVPLLPETKVNDGAGQGGQAPAPYAYMSTGLATIYEKLVVAGFVHSASSGYNMKQALSFGASGAAPDTPTNVGAQLQALFDCDSQTGLSAAKVPAGQPVPKTLLQKSMDKLNGPVDFGTYGSILPMFGWGSTGKRAPNAALKAGTGYAMNQNYAAMGNLVYLATNTPFVHTLNKIQGMTDAAINAGAHGFAVDYVIFLDKNYKQVPLQTVVVAEIQEGSGIYWPSIELNPKAEYMVSLLTVGLQGYPLMYAANGTRYYVGSTGAKTAKTTRTTVSSTVQSTVIAAANSALQSLQQTYPGLYEQYTTHKAALLQIFRAGPFVYGNDKLVNASNLALTIGTTTINVYQGADVTPGTGTGSYATSSSVTCYGSTSVADLLLAYNGNPNTDDNATTATLPNNQAQYFISLVTDIIYQVQADGSLIPSDFSDAPLKLAKGSTTSYTIDSTKVSTYTWLGALTGAQGVNATAAKALEKYVKDQRKAWIAAFSTNSLAAGAQVGNLTVKLASGLDSTAIQNGCYICQVTPNPSLAFTNTDWFVAVDTPNPVLSTLNIVNPLSGTAKALVSLVTGTVYDMQGDLLPLSGGKAQKVSVVVPVGSTDTTGQIIATTMINKFSGKGMTPAFINAYNTAVLQYAQTVDDPIAQGEFGSVQLGIYAGDLAEKTYVYFDASGMSNSENFVPQDLYIVADPSKPTGQQFGGPLTATTPYIMSVVSGQMYSTTGARAVFAQAKLQALVSTLLPTWRAHVVGIYNTLMKNYQQLQLKEQQEKQALEQQEKAAGDQTGNNLLTASQVTTMISQLGADTLPVPYQLLKQNPVTGQLVHLSPASTTDENKYIYLFFNALASTTGTTQTGAIYDDNGTVVCQLSGPALDIMKWQFGVHGTGMKYLGVPMMQPAMIMSAADKALRPGSSGTSMILSTSANFPGSNITMPTGYYLYYNTIMDNYYVFDVTNQQWISVSGGHVYSIDSTPMASDANYIVCQPMPVQNRVAINSSGTNDMILLKENSNGYMQGTMLDSTINSYAEFKNSGSGSWTSTSGASVTVPASASKVTAASDITTYTVTQGTTSKTYNVNSAYAWNELVYLPITTLPSSKTPNSGATLLPEAQRADESYNSLKVVTNNGAIQWALFNGIMYKVSGSVTANSPITMTPISGSGSSIILTQAVDSNTHVPYISIKDSQGDEYQYGYVYQALDQAQMDAYRLVWKGTVTTCPSHTAVGPMLTQTITIHGQQKVISNPTAWTYKIFTQDIAGTGTNLSFTQMTTKGVSGIPQDLAPSELSIFQNYGINRVYKLNSANRWLARVYKADGNQYHKPYVNQDGYVDLQTGALYSLKGKATGMSISLVDWLALLDAIQVTVLIEKTGVSGQKTNTPTLVYRSTSTVGQQLQQQTGQTGSKSKKIKPTDDDDSSDNSDIWDNGDNS